MVWQDMMIFFIEVTVYVSNHIVLLLLNFFRNDMITQVLVGLEHLNQLLFEHFVNIYRSILPNEKSNWA